MIKGGKPENERKQRSDDVRAGDFNVAAVCLRDFNRLAGLLDVRVFCAAERGFPIQSSVVGGDFGKRCFERSFCLCETIFGTTLAAVP